MRRAFQARKTACRELADACSARWRVGEKFTVGWKIAGDKAHRVGRA